MGAQAEIPYSGETGNDGARAPVRLPICIAKAAIESIEHVRAGNRI